MWVLAPNAEHFSYCKQALGAGKHVVVEKPVTPTSHEAYELADLARSKGLVLAVYQNRRWDADFLTLKQLIDKGEFGELSEFESSFDRYKNVLNAKQWKEADIPGAGAAYDLGSHVVRPSFPPYRRPRRTSLTRSPPAD